jgi:hypothetical protein
VQTNQPFHPIDVIFDTGAAITMLPGEYTEAWTNLRPCLHKITGCFSGVEQDNNYIGEFHAILTTDDGEAIRVIIPEAISVPQGVSNTFLLAETPYLMQGQKYISDLYQPHLHLSDHTIYTMSVQRAHKIVKLLPISATTQTSHRAILLHSRDPYDPPTYINNAIFTKTHNRPNTRTPTAFIYLGFFTKQETFTFILAQRGFVDIVIGTCAPTFICLT